MHGRTNKASRAGRESSRLRKQIKFEGNRRSSFGGCFKALVGAQTDNMIINDKK